MMHARQIEMNTTKPAMAALFLLNLHKASNHGFVCAALKLSFLLITTLLFRLGIAVSGKAKPDFRIH